MSDDQPPHSLDELEARLRKARERSTQGSSRGSKVAQVTNSAFGAAFRIGVELLAAMIVGVGGGLLLDRWLGTAPWGLIGMFFLGAGAGVLNVYRAINGLGLGAGYGRGGNGIPPADGRDKETPAASRGTDEGPTDDATGGGRRV